jgi:hypothetical protein
MALITTSPLRPVIVTTAPSPPQQQQIIPRITTYPVIVVPGGGDDNDTKRVVSVPSTSYPLIEPLPTPRRTTTKGRKIIKGAESKKDDNIRQEIEIRDAPNIATIRHLNKTSELATWFMDEHRRVYMIDSSETAHYWKEYKCPYTTDDEVFFWVQLASAGNMSKTSQNTFQATSIGYTQFPAVGDIITCKDPPGHPLYNEQLPISQASSHAGSTHRSRHTGWVCIRI